MSGEEPSSAGPGDLVDPTDATVGKILSERYRVLRKLGEGGMGSVYLAEHVLIQKRVALKVLAPELTRREELAARFLQEARAASRIGQENVIDISDFGRSDGLVFFVMEYLEGQDLGALLRGAGAIGWARARGIVLQICKALRAAHSRGIVHRDLKPENVFLIEREGQADFVKLLDFGIAKISGEGLTEAGPRLTRTGMIFGTPEYMAPEQAEGKAADHRADLYAVGCVLYHCLTGVTPFSADSFMAMLTKHLVEAVVPPSQRRPGFGISPEIDALVQKALEKDRDHRFSSADEFMAAINAIPLGLDSGAGAPGSTTAAVPVATQLFGAGSAGRVPLAPQHQVPRTEVVGAVEDGAGIPGPRARRSPVMLLAAAGIALGVGAAVAFAVRRDAPPAPVAPPAAAAVGAAVTPAVTPPPALGNDASAPAVAPAFERPPATTPPPAVAPSPGPRPKRIRRAAERATAAEPAPPRGSPVPAELKPFPQ